MDSYTVSSANMDGTLMGELFPTYLEAMLLTECILADPSYQPDELTEKCQTMGYNVISMADDWKMIYGAGIELTPFILRYLAAECQPLLATS